MSDNLEVTVPNDRKWYSLRVISGKEKKAKEAIDLELLRSGWQQIVTQVVVPTEKVYKIERNILFQT